MEQNYYFPARINQRAASPAPTADAVTWSAEISSNRLDAYFTRMAESTLRNFAQDAQTGVAFLDSHDNRRLGYGQSLNGVFQVETGVSRVVADFYTVPGVKFGGGLTYQSTDDFIRAMQAGLIRDVSVGFYGGDMVCDICGNSFYDWRGCPHWPGQEYAVGDQGSQTTVATFQITDARLAEVSAVYDGATPGAMIQRARAMAEAGELAPETARRLEMQYRIKLPETRVFPVAKPAAMPERSNTVDKLEQIRQLIAQTGLDYEDPADAVRFLIEECARLTPLADQGKQYRADLIDQAMAEGVRALGDTFPAETYRGIMERAGIEQIKEIRDNFAAHAARQFPGKRQTVDAEQPPRQAAPRVPDIHYKS